jgi:hypothetical protein
MSDGDSSCHADAAAFSRALAAALDSGSLPAWDALQAAEFRSWPRAEDRGNRFEAWRRDLSREHRDALRVGPHRVEGEVQPFLVVGASAEDPAAVIHVVRETGCLRINDQ